MGSDDFAKSEELNKQSMKNKKYPVTRRNFIKVSAATTAAVSTMSFGACNTEKVPTPMKRPFGKLGFDVTTLGLGGQASIQWTPDDVVPEDIILKAFALGINYFDTSNLYQKSQLHFNKAFKQLHLIPGENGYNKKLRESIWLTSKTGMRWGKPGWTERDGVNNWSQGENVKCAVDDVKRSLTQIFGDGQGYYPEGAYLNMVLCHTLNSPAEVDVLYEGLETPLDKDRNFGALVALRDLRDGTNLTGMNPKEETLIRHIGFSGHAHPPAMMDMIQRDEYGLLEGLLVAINANDKTKMNMQNNVIPVAEAKGMGIIGMKVFADAALYHKEPRWSQTPDDVFRNVGTPELPSKPLIEYSLTTPGVHTLIIGIGHIDEDPMKCQLVQNFYAAQIAPDGMSPEERKRIEEQAKTVRPESNYFQKIPKENLSAPRDAKIVGNKLSWQSALADNEAISHYEVLVNDKLVGTVEHKPQTLKSRPFLFELEELGTKIVLATIDKAKNRAEIQLV